EWNLQRQPPIDVFISDNYGFIDIRPLLVSDTATNDRTYLTGEPFTLTSKVYDKFGNMLFQVPSPGNQTWTVSNVTDLDGNPQAELDLDSFYSQATSGAPAFANGYNPLNFGISNRVALRTDL